MHLKRYKTKLEYKYMILEAGTNRCLVNLGCVSPREAQAELRTWLTDANRQHAIAKFRLHDDALLVTDYLKQYVERYLPAKAEKTITSELEAIAKFKEFFAGIPLGRLAKADLQRYINWRLAARHSRRGTSMSPSTINLELRYLKHILKGSSSVGRNLACDQGRSCRSNLMILIWSASYSRWSARVNAGLRIGNLESSSSPTIWCSTWR
jgi:hypothetical protein